MSEKDDHNEINRLCGMTPEVVTEMVNQNRKVMGLPPQSAPLIPEISEHEFNLAMLIVRNHWPNTAEVIRLYIEQRERVAWEAARADRVKDMEACWEAARDGDDYCEHCNESRDCKWGNVYTWLAEYDKKER